MRREQRDALQPARPLGLKRINCAASSNMVRGIRLSGRSRSGKAVRVIALESLMLRVIALLKCVSPCSYSPQCISSMPIWACRLALLSSSAKCSAPSRQGISERLVAIVRPIRHPFDEAGQRHMMRRCEIRLQFWRSIQQLARQLIVGLGVYDPAAAAWRQRS